MGDETYEIYAIRYGWGARRSSENFMQPDPHDTDMPLAYFVWALKGADGRVIVLDTGFEAAAGARRGRETTRPVVDGLKAIGIDPETVQDVILSHMHYDHAGNTDLFPRARFHLQETEMAYATGRCMCHAEIRHPFDVDDVTTLVRRVFDGRVQFHDGAEEIAPGVTVHPIGGHSKGLQSVRVRTARGWVVLASDASHLYAHMEQNRAFPVLYNHYEVLRGYDRLRGLASTPDHIVPGHDPLVTAIYPAAAPGTEDWIVRLDPAPRR